VEQKKQITGACDIIEEWYGIVFTTQRKRAGHTTSWERTITETKLWQADTWIWLQKSTQSTTSLSDSHGEKNWERFPILEFVIGQTFSFPHYISALFIWCWRVCYFVWWTRVLCGHHATLVCIEKMGALEKLCLRAPTSLIWHCAPLPVNLQAGSAAG